MSGIPSGNPARQNFQVDNSIHRILFGTYVNEGIHTSEGTINSYQTIINNPRLSDPLGILSGSSLKLSDQLSRNVVLPPPHLTLERPLILLDVPNPRGLASFAE